MKCYHPQLCWLTENRGLIFNERKLRFSDNATPITIPCGKCPACLVNKASEWALRCQHEMQYASFGAFLTLTYNSDNLPEGYQLQKKDIQDFFKRLRRYYEYHHLPPIRSYLVCGEYGEKRGRPHYHAFVVGLDIPDLKYHHLSYHGDPVYTSNIIEQIWGNGYVIIGTCTKQSAGYVARYAKKMVNNVGNRNKPFFLSSRNIPLSNGQKGALGSQWLIDNHTDLLRGYLPDGENKYTIPDYYMRLLERFYPDDYKVCLANQVANSVKNDIGFLAYEKKFGTLLTSRINFCYNKGVEYEKACESVKKFCSVEGDFDYSDLVDFLTEKFQNMDEAQMEKINKLRRNLDE